MSRRTPLVLLALCALLAIAWVVLEERSSTGPASRRTALFPFAADEVRALEIVWRAKTAPPVKLRLERTTDGRWSRVPSDANAPRVDAAQIRAALAELELIDRGGLVAGTAPSANHGLSPPALEVRATDTRRRDARIAFGDATGLGRVFAAYDGTVYVVPMRARHAFRDGPRDYDDPHVFSGDLRRFARIEIGDTRIERRDGEVFVSPPAGALADKEKLREIVARLGGLPREAIADGAASSASRVVASIHVGETAQRADLRREAPAVRALLEALEAVVSLRPGTLRAAELERMEIVDDRGAELSIVRPPGDDVWRILAASADASAPDLADESLVRAFLGAIHRLEARSVLPAGAASFERPSRRFHFVSGVDRVTLEVSAALAGGKERHVRRGRGSAVYVVDDGEWAAASARALDWRRRVLWDFPPASVEALSLDGAEVRRNDRYRWTLRRSATAAAREITDPGEHAAIDTLVRTFAAAPVARFLDASSAAAPARHRLVLETIDGTKRTRHTAHIGPQTSTGRAVETGGTRAILEAKAWQSLRLFRGP